MLWKNCETTSEENNETRREAVIFLKALCNFRFICFLQFWNQVLSIVNRFQKRLQDHQLSFHSAARELQALLCAVQREKDSIPCVIVKAEEFCDENDIPIVERRVRRQKRQAGETAQSSELGEREEFRRQMISCLDTINAEVYRRSNRLLKIDEDFGYICSPEWVHAGNEGLPSQCRKLKQTLGLPITEADLYNELKDFKALVKTAESPPTTTLEMVQELSRYGKDVFPNLETIFKKVLAISVSVASCERSFFKLKLILHYLQTSMSQSRLSDLAISLSKRKWSSCSTRSM